MEKGDGIDMTVINYYIGLAKCRYYFYNKTYELFTLLTKTRKI